MEDGFYDVENDSITIEASVKVKSIINDDDPSRLE